MIIVGLTNVKIWFYRHCLLNLIPRGLVLGHNCDRARVRRLRGDWVEIIHNYYYFDESPEDLMSTYGDGILRTQVPTPASPSTGAPTPSVYPRRDRRVGVCETP